MSPAERAKVVPRVCMVGGKAYATYLQAKRIVKLVNAVGKVVNNDPEIGDKLKAGRFLFSRLNFSFLRVLCGFCRRGRGAAARGETRACIYFRVDTSTSDERCGGVFSRRRCSLSPTTTCPSPRRSSRCGRTPTDTAARSPPPSPSLPSAHARRRR